MSEAATGFRAGFASRHQAAADVLAQAFATPTSGFAARAVAPRAPGPRHFAPADRDRNPTQGWDPMDPEPVQPTAASFIDPLATAHAAGYAEGMAAALATASEERVRDRALIDGLLAQLAATDRFDRDAVARRLRQTVLLLVTRMVGEAGISAELLAARVEAAVGLLADASESALLHLHPDDVALVDGRLPATVFAVGDAKVARGSFTLETASTAIEDGPDLWLDQLAAAIERIAVPRC